MHCWIQESEGKRSNYMNKNKVLLQSLVFLHNLYNAILKFKLNEKTNCRRELENEYWFT
jgi:hypothetical protein